MRFAKHRVSLLLVKTSPTRIAALQALIVEIQDVWTDSDEQERAFFETELARLHAEIAAVRAAADLAAATKRWNASVKRAVKAIEALSTSSDLGYEARHAESQRIHSSLHRAEARAFASDLSVADEAAKVRETVEPAREAAGRWYAERLDSEIRASKKPVLTYAERQYHADLRRAF